MYDNGMFSVIHSWSITEYNDIFVCKNLEKIKDLILSKAGVKGLISSIYHNSFDFDVRC